jgi:predicted enzyme related to lactoylglutathione lyase
MADFSTGKHGEISWYELTTQNVDAAKPFYQELFGWGLEQSKLSPVPYTEITVNGTAVGGMMRIDEQWGEGWDKIPPHWMTYITVDNVDATIEVIKANGGASCMPAFDLPNIGRLGICNDPSGAVFTIIQFNAPA